MLEDGKWHSYQEILKFPKLSKVQLIDIVGFLRNFDIVDIDEKEKRIKIDKSFLELPLNA